MKKLAVGLLSFHFLMLVLGILHINLPGRFLGKAQVYYSRLTGGGGSFGFFSPNVPREVELSFEIHCPAKAPIKTTLQEHLGGEVRARVGNMTNLLASHFRNDSVVRSVAASLTAAIWREYPCADTVTLEADLYKFPTMAEYRACREKESSGVCVKLLPVYSATFGKVR